MIFLNLPDVLLSEIFIKWIEFKNVAKLDSSLTNHKLRKNLLEALCLPESAYDYDKMMDLNLCNWLNARSVQLKSLWFDFDCINDSGNLILKTSLLSKVTKLVVQCFLNVNTFSAIMNSC